MGKNGTTKMVLNFLGWGIAIFAIWKLLDTTQYVQWLFVLLFGAILVGGLPDFQKVKKRLSAAPAALLLSIGLIIYLFKAYGDASVSQMFFTTLIGLFVIALLVVPTLQEVLKD